MSSAGAGEYMLSSGLVYLNTGSVGSTRRAVLERTIEVWTALEVYLAQDTSELGRAVALKICCREKVNYEINT